MGGFLANITDPLLVWLRIDDAVGATCVHGFGGAWGMIAVGIFAKKEEYVSYTGYDGALHGKIQPKCYFLNNICLSSNFVLQIKTIA